MIVSDGVIEDSDFYIYGIRYAEEDEEEEDWFYFYRQDQPNDNCIWRYSKQRDKDQLWSSIPRWSCDEAYLEFSVSEMIRTSFKYDFRVNEKYWDLYELFKMKEKL